MQLLEYTDGELARELRRRAESREQGLCDFCNRRLGRTPSCRMNTRHHASSLPLKATRSVEIATAIRNSLHQLR